MITAKTYTQTVHGDCVSQAMSNLTELERKTFSTLYKTPIKEYEKALNFLEKYGDGIEKEQYIKLLTVRFKVQVFENKL